MRSALIVGIDYYNFLKRLQGCVKDATSVAEVLRYHGNTEPNFKTPKLMTSTSQYEPIPPCQ